VAVDLDRGYGILIHALDAFYKQVIETMVSQNVEEILMGDSVESLLKV
jgi:hypothetical protein